ncbi:MAG TPA: hypothetical protein PLK94_14280, partial [Alphaproteobacteria bacterium]|nr:hypothetical protein [Alphaproteobacteria bacterium]
MSESLVNIQDHEWSQKVNLPVFAFSSERNFDVVSASKILLSSRFHNLMLKHLLDHLRRLLVRCPD